MTGAFFLFIFHLGLLPLHPHKSGLPSLPSVVVVVVVREGCQTCSRPPQQPRWKSVWPEETTWKRNERRKQTPLISSIKRGNKQVFFSLLQHGADPNHSPPDSMKPIQWAASEGWKDMVEALVKAGADVNENEGGEGTPLFIAAEKGAVDVTEGLLALGADTEIKDGVNGNTPLMWPVRKVMKMLLIDFWQQEPSSTLRTDNGNSPLILASMKGHLGIVDRLVIHGANINHQNNNGWTALMWASKWSCSCC
jgi:ankyrin repeat protein